MDSELSAAEPEPLRLMTYSHDGYGLGHLKRNSAIAARFVQDVADSTALMLTGCRAGNPLYLPQGVDYLKLPSLIKVNTGVYVPLGLRISRQKAKAIRSSTIQSVVAEFTPHVFLVDHVPAGIHGELLPTLRMLRQLDDPPAIVLGLRDIIDDPKVVCELWHKEMTYRTIREFFDEVLVYGSREIFDAARHYQLNTEFPCRITYCGYVCAEAVLKSKEQIREELRIQKEKLVVVTAGGGHDAYPLMQSCLEAFQLMGGEIPFEVLVITGPLMEPQHREQLRDQGRRVGARVLTCVEDLSSYINTADLVITMAGYNSLCEAVSLKQKALVVPRLGPRAEQRMRAELFQKKGWIDVLDAREATARNLADRVLRNLERGGFRPTDAAIETCGARNAAKRIRALAAGRGAHERPAREPNQAVRAFSDRHAALPSVSVRSRGSAAGK